MLKRALALILCLCLLCGLVPTAQAAGLTVITQPKNASAYAGEKATTTVTAEGNGLTYEWYIAAKGSSKFSKSSITSKTYGVKMSESNDGRQVYCVVKDANGNSEKTNTVTLSMRTALTVTSQPKSVTVKEGATAKVTIAATGDGLTYAWYYKNPGAAKFSKTSSFTGTTYSVKMDASRDGRQVYCVITDKYGSTVQTNTATLSMQHPVKITAQPKTVYAYEGATAKTTVTATGDGLTYQWYIASATGTKFSKSSITGATYSVKMSTSNDGRKAYCIVTDKYGNTAKSNTVTLNVAAPFAITQQPKSVAVKQGETAKVTFSVKGEGLTYTWYYKNAGATKFTKTTSFTGNTYSLKMDTSRDGRQIYCVVKDQYGNSVQTNTVTLSMQHPVKLVAQPKDAWAYEGETAKVTVDATGDGLTYTWYFKNPGASKFSKTNSFTGNTYSVNMDESRNGRQVYCVVTDKYGNSVQTNTATLAMVPAVKIIAQPKNAYGSEGDKVTVSVEAQGEGLSYQWYYANAGKTTFYKASITSASYTVELTKSRAGRQLYCVITDAYGNTVTSDTVTLAITTKLEITKQPMNACVDENVMVNVSVSAQGDEITYQWYYADKGATEFTLSSAASDTYTTSVNDDCDGRKVYCVITDMYGNTVKTETVTVGFVPAGLDYFIEDGVCIIMGYSGSATHLTIPGTIDGWPVINIYHKAFYECTSLENVSIPSSVTHIGDYAFMACYSLKSITLPNSVKSVGDSAFQDCDAMEHITLGSGLTKIGSAAFYNCAALKRVTLPNGVTSIGAAAFMDCYALESITLGNRVTNIDQYAFAGCKSLKSITLPGTLTTIGNDAFSGCTMLESITIPNGVTSIGEFGFHYCTSLKSVTLPYGIRSIGEGAFSSCTSLASIAIPSSVTGIEQDVFWNCSSLKNVTIPNSMTSIGAFAFGSCASLTSITIPSSVTSIEEYAFDETPVTVKCTSDSYAYTYCKNNGIKYLLQ